MVAHFQRMWRYTDWADGRMLRFFDSVDAVPEQCRALMAHIAAAQQVWLARITQTTPKPDAIWPDWSRERLVAASVRARTDWMAYADDLTSDALARSVHYQSLGGDPFETPLADIMIHVINHSTHHRAQIASAARAEDLTPPPTDFIYFVREGR